MTAENRQLFIYHPAALPDSYEGAVHNPLSQLEAKFYEAVKQGGFPGMALAEENHPLYPRAKSFQFLVQEGPSSISSEGYVRVVESFMKLSEGFIKYDNGVIGLSLVPNLPDSEHEEDYLQEKGLLHHQLLWTKIFPQK